MKQVIAYWSFIILIIAAGSYATKAIPGQYDKIVTLYCESEVKAACPIGRVIKIKVSHDNSTLAVYNRGQVVIHTNIDRVEVDVGRAIGFARDNR